MQSYQDITVIPSDDIASNFILSKVFMQLHLAFVEMKKPDDTLDTGISFPGYHARTDDKPPALGDKIRLHFLSSSDSSRLSIEDKLARLSSYVKVGLIKQVPEYACQSIIVKRIRPELDSPSKIRRYARRNNLTVEEARRKRFLQYHEKRKSEQESPIDDLRALPFLTTESLSSRKRAAEQHRYPLFILQQKVDQPRNGGFNTYGLSNGATVPHW